jgi:hypothetical protein
MDYYLLSLIAEKLKVTKSSGPDQLHPKYLHETAKNISTTLATNFNISMETKKLPESWKEATVPCRKLFGSLNI